MSLKERYGPWALIVGGSEGIGDHLARKLGAAGINIVMVARKPGPLAETSQRVRDESSVEVRTMRIRRFRCSSAASRRGIEDKALKYPLRAPTGT